MAIKSFKCRDTEALFSSEQSPGSAISVARPFASSSSWTWHAVSRICAYLRAIDWKRSKETAKVNGASVSTTATAFASFGELEMPKKSKSSTTTEKRLAPVSVGEMLVEEFLKPLEMTNYRLAKEIGVPPQRIGDIIAGRRAVTADTDLRLCRFFGMSEGWWLRLQMDHDLRTAKMEMADKLAKIKPWKERR